MRQHHAARSRPGSIGFGAKVITPEDRKQGEIFRDVEPEDLLKYGLIPEFVGRLPVVATLEDLDTGMRIRSGARPVCYALAQIAYTTIEGETLVLSLRAYTAHDDMIPTC